MDLHRGKVFVVLCAWCSIALAFPSNRHRIPNGFRIPCPEGAYGCREGFCWGVGHTTCAGHGALNVFGLDFDAAGHKWTKELCEKDSDGDGLTNGEELGDPCCLFQSWSIVSDYTSSFQPSHPGDFFNVVAQYTKPSSCASTAPKAIAPEMGKFNKGEEQLYVDMYIKNYTIPMPGTVSKRTTYMDFPLNFPDNRDLKFHAILADAIVKTPKNLHHYVVRGCTGKWPEHMVGRPLEETRGTEGYKRLRCYEDFAGIGGWVPGRPIFEMPPWAGLPIGAGFGFDSFMVQVHYDNPDLETGIVSNDGLRIYYTAPRKQELTFFNTMQVSVNPTMILPPHKARYFMTRRCDLSLKDSAGKAAEGHILTVSFHAHLLGTEMYAERIRGEERLTLAEDKVWFFDDQYEDVIYLKNYTVKDGDRLETTCIFDSRSRQGQTLIGQETTDEMCWAFFLLTEGGFKATCKGEVWTGELDDDESGIGLQSKHPVNVADGIWTGTDLLTGGSLVSTKYKGSACADNGQMESYCPMIVGMATGPEMCDMTFTEVGFDYDLIADMTPLNLCCSLLCETLCPDNLECPQKKVTMAPTTAPTMAPTEAPTMAPTEALTMAASTAAPQTVKESANKVSTVVTMKGLDFDKVNGNAEVKTALVASIKQSFLKELPAGYTEEDLEVTLSKGSVKAQVDITPLAGSDSATLQTTLTKSQGAVLTALDKDVKAMPTLLWEAGVTEVGISASDPVVSAKIPSAVASTAQAGSSSGTETSTSGVAPSTAAVVAALAMVFATIG